MIAAGAAGEGADLGLGGQCGLAAGAASDLLAPGAGEDRIVPGSGHLDEDRARYASVAGARPQSGAHDRPGTAGDPLPGEGITVLIGNEDDGRRVAAGGAGGGDPGEPGGRDVSLHFGAAVGGHDEDVGGVARRRSQTDPPR